MERALAVFAGLLKDGVITSYAIGGAMAAVFYTEPIPTYDLDVFVSLPGPPKALVTLEPLYSRLGSLGYQPSKEHVVIEGIPVQFIPAYNRLVEESLAKAREIAYGAQRARVVGPEHLLAIMLQTGRPKDLARISQFVDQTAIDRAVLRDILARHGLDKAWKAEWGGLDG